MVDVWLEDEDQSGELSITTNHGNCTYLLKDIAMDELTTPFGGMDKAIQVSRLPDVLDTTHLSVERTIKLNEARDTRLFIRLYQEDGHRAWSSPIYLI